MTDKERLCFLLSEITHENCFGSIEKIANHLIDNDVTFNCVPRGYVLGYSEYNLVKLKEKSVYISSQLQIEDIIIAVERGYYNAFEATVFSTLDDAQATLREIKDNFDSISFYSVSILETMLDDKKEFKPDQLKIFSIELRGENGESL